MTRRIVQHAFWFAAAAVVLVLPVTIGASLAGVS